MLTLLAWSSLFWFASGYNLCRWNACCVPFFYYFVCRAVPEFDFFLFLAFLIGVFALALPLLGSGAASSKSESFSRLTLTEGFFCQYKCFGLTTCVVGVVLLVALVAVLEFGFEHGRSALRKL